MSALKFLKSMWAVGEPWAICLRFRKAMVAGIAINTIHMVSSKSGSRTENEARETFILTA
jgi:hypothetical protein